MFARMNNDGNIELLDKRNGDVVKTIFSIISKKDFIDELDDETLKKFEGGKTIRMEREK